MPRGKRIDGPINSQQGLIFLLEKHNGSTLAYLAHCTERGLSERSLYQRLKRLESDGYVTHHVDPFVKRITHRYFLTTKAFETYFPAEYPFEPRVLLPELKYKHDYRRVWAEKYTPSDQEYNKGMLEQLFPNSEISRAVLQDALRLLEDLGQGLGFLFEGKELEAAVRFDTAAHTRVPRLIGRLHAVYWANHVLAQACVEAGRVLTPGPEQMLTIEEIREGRERFRAAFDQCLQSHDVNREAFEVNLKLSEITHAQEAAAGKLAMDRRISDAETIRLDDEFQAERFRKQRAERELDIELHQARQQRAETGSTFTPGSIDEDEGEPEGDQ